VNTWLRGTVVAWLLGRWIAHDAFEFEPWVDVGLDVSQWLEVRLYLWQGRRVSVAEERLCPGVAGV
jgi:hypothetical protein